MPTESYTMTSYSTLTAHVCAHKDRLLAAQSGKPIKTGRAGTSTTTPLWLLERQFSYKLTLVP